jgi:hypothetical protein
MTNDTVSGPAVEHSAHKQGKVIYIVVIIIVIIALVWLLVRPGVFTVQPIGAIPEGVTIIYHSRNSKMSFFSSPDSILSADELNGGIYSFWSEINRATTGKYTTGRSKESGLSRPNNRV